MLHDKVYAPQFVDIGPEFNLYSVEKNDFYDAAGLIKQMNMIVTVDTSILHLAGALGTANVFGMLSSPSDARWQSREWYPNVNLVRDFQGTGTKAFKVVEVVARNQCIVEVIKRIKVKPEGTSILITGGIGDYIALESFMSAEMKAKVSRIYLATRAGAAISKLIPRSFNSPEVIEIMADYTTPFYHIADVSAYLQSINCPLPVDWEYVDDWSIFDKFPQIDQGEFDYKGCGIIDFEPQESGYITVCPMTNTEVGTGRDFSDSDWASLKSYLESHGLVGVVVAGEVVDCPDCPSIINVSGKTNLMESIEILKRSSGYVGIDSFMSVLASKFFAKDRLLIKSINDHLIRNAGIYYAPHKWHDFIKPAIDAASLTSLRCRS